MLTAPLEMVASGVDGWSCMIWSALGFAAAAIAALAVLAALVLLLLRAISWLGRRYPILRMLGSNGRYVVKDVSDPPQCTGAGAIVRAPILDEVLDARQGARTMTVLDGPGATLPSPVVELPANYKWLTPLVNSLFTRPCEATVTALPADGGKVAPFAMKTPVASCWRPSWPRPRLKHHWTPSCGWTLICL